ncbi:hypothetical protein, partial [Pseudomonas fragi]|uniref:hypothetical protein n=1 Tax=Pseudomonas fragi TaxID=296 RepID=UPI001CB6EBF4
DERSEAAIGGEAVAKQDTCGVSVALGIRVYGRFAPDRSLAALVSGYNSSSACCNAPTIRRRGPWAWLSGTIADA